MPEQKGNPYRFTLLFNQTDPRHRRAVEILNQQGKSKSQYIATAILHYVGCNKLPVESAGAYQSLQELADRIAEQTAARVLESLKKYSPQRESPPSPIVQLPTNQNFSEEITEQERKLLETGLGALRSRKHL